MDWAGPTLAIMDLAVGESTNGVSICGRDRPFPHELVVEEREQVLLPDARGLCAGP